MNLICFPFQLPIPANRPDKPVSLFNCDLTAGIFLGSFPRRTASIHLYAVSIELCSAHLPPVVWLPPTSWCRDIKLGVPRIWPVTRVCPPLNRT